MSVSWPSRRSPGSDARPAVADEPGVRVRGNARGARCRDPGPGRRIGRGGARAADLRGAPRSRPRRRGGRKARAGRHLATGRGAACAGGAHQARAQEHGVQGRAAAQSGSHDARGGAAHDAESTAAPRRGAVHGERRGHGEHGGDCVPVPRVPVERAVGDSQALAPQHGGVLRRGVVLHSSGWVRDRHTIREALGQLCLRPRCDGCGGRSEPDQGVRRAPRGLAVRRAVRAVLFRAAAAVVMRFAILAACLVTRLAAQDTSAIDRGVRIGIRPPAPRPGTRTSAGGGAQTLGPNYPLYQALGADFAVDVAAASDTTVVTVHDVAAAAVRRSLRVRLPPVKDPGFRLAVHRLSDQVVQGALGAAGIAATRVLFVVKGKVYRIDQDDADMTLVSSSDREAMSPAWSEDGRRFSYMEFWSGHGQLFLQDMASAKRAPVFSTGQALDFTPAFSPDGKTLAFSRATEEGTDIYTVNVKDNCCLQLLPVRKFSDNLSPTYSADGQRIAFVSTRPGLPQIYVMAADGTDQQLFAPFDYGVTGSSNAPEWAPAVQSVAFHRDVGGTLQVCVLDVRTRTVRQLTSVGRNEDPTC